MVMDRKKTVETTTTFGSNQVCSNKNNLDQVSSVVRIRRNGPQNLRSPAAKRALSAPVAHQGWLQKQGSEGLMLWKKRWFVLCEYCLFYYKGPEEEKLLGSILLPSYTITVCSADEKINKKFAFKAEHANMRTYHFAADSRESMNHWINVLTLASLLQDPNPDAASTNQVSRQNKPSANQSEDDSDSGFHGFQNRNESNLASVKSPKALETNYQMYLKKNQFPNYYCHPNNDQQLLSIPNYGLPILKMQCNQITQPQMTRQYQNDKQYCMDSSYNHQHCYQHDSNSSLRNNFGHPNAIYANALTNKRKPMLGNDASALCYSTNPMDLNYNNAWFKLKAKMPFQPANDEIYDCRSAQQMLRVDKLGSLNYYGSSQLPERRTPDTYGRNSNNNTNSSNSISNSNNINNNNQSSNIDKDRDQDYEDVYAATSHFNDERKVDFSSCIVQGDHVFNDRLQQDNLPVKASAAVEPLPRPHSADILEHEVMKRSQNSLSTNQSGNIELTMKKKNPPQRPKSSIDVVYPHDVAPTNDNYFYSEEYYAAQMRQRAAYLHQSPQIQQQMNEASCQDVRDDMKNSFLKTKQNFPTCTQSYQSLSKPSQRNHRFNRDNISMRRSLRERNHQVIDQELVNQSSNLPMRVTREIQDVRYNCSNKLKGQTRHPSNRRCQDQWFMRSASARFPTSSRSIYDNQENNTGLCEGERKREESMKRLLEWKQRMLQSPLTRKPSSTSSGSAIQNDLTNYYEQDSTKSDTIRNSRRLGVKRDPLVRSKSTDGHRVTNVITYDSYSSDDEGMDEKQNQRLCETTNGIKSSTSFDHIDLTKSYEKKLMSPQSDDIKLNNNARCKAERSSKSEVAISIKSECIDKSMDLKRPKGILKTTSTAGCCDLAADYEGEIMSGILKNVQWTSPCSKNRNNHHQWDYKLNEQDVVKECSYQYIKPSDIGSLSEEQLMKDDNDDTNKVQSMIKSFEQVNTHISPRQIVKVEKPLQVTSSPTTKANIARLDTMMLMEQESIDLDLGSHAKTVKALLADFEMKSKDNVDDDIMCQGVVTDAETLQKIMDRNNVSTQMKSEYAEAIKRKTELTKKRRRRKTLTIMNKYDESLMTKSDDIIDNNLITSPDMTINAKSEKSTLENIYLPMNPRKNILNADNEYDADCCRRPTNMMQSLFANFSNEESSYVEMTQRGFTHSLLAPDDDDKMNFTNPHYELVCVGDNIIEPVYMEVHNINNEFAQNAQDFEISTDGERITMRSDLPDILNNLKSDSSDADDESYCKQLDSIKTPRHPRFSLSDTFRPASYYLSTPTNHALMPDTQHDSSDSDLVSPPPIPRSPPPIDEFGPSIPSSSSSSNQAQIKVHTEDWTRLMNKYSSSKIISALRNNRSPLDSTITRELMKFIKPSDENIFNYDNVSGRDDNGNDDEDDDDEDEDDDEDDDDDDDDVVKRRPVESQKCHVLDILDQFKILSSCQIDQKNCQEQQKNLDLSCSNSIYTNNSETATRTQMTFDSSNFLLQNDDKLMTKTNSVSSLPSMRVSDILPCQHKHSQSFTGNAHYENVSPLHDASMVKSSRSSSPSSSSLLLEGEEMKVKMKDKTNNDSSSSPVNNSLSFSSPQLISRIQQQHLSNESEGSRKCFVASNFESLYSTNTCTEKSQTRISEAQENIVQQGAPYYYSDLRSQEINQSQVVPENVRTTTINDDNITSTAVVKSIEMNDSSMMKSPHVLQSSHRRSRSLEGLLDDVGLESFIRHQTAVAADNDNDNDNAATATATTTDVVMNKTKNVSYIIGGDDPWEQDSLWRENLRMVSMRHAKSLDSLNNSKMDKSSILSSNDEKSSNAKIQHTSPDFEFEPNKIIYCESESKDNFRSNELATMSSAADNRPKNCFELDREKLRQWDLLSSACLLQEQQQATSLTAAELFAKGLSRFESSSLVTHFSQPATSNVTSTNSVDENPDEWTLQPDAVYKKLM